METIDIRVCFITYHIFEDSKGNKYYTDEWQEDDVEMELEQESIEAVINETLMLASENAKYLVVECKKYEYIDAEDENLIEGLRLVKTTISRVRYDRYDSNDITIDGEHVREQI